MQTLEKVAVTPEHLQTANAYGYKNTDYIGTVVRLRPEEDLRREHVDVDECYEAELFTTTGVVIGSTLNFDNKVHCHYVDFGPCTPNPNCMSVTVWVDDNHLQQPLVPAEMPA